MSKSRASKTKAAGAADSLSVYGKNYRQQGKPVMADNRQMRRMLGERGKRK